MANFERVFCLVCQSELEIGEVDDVAVVERSLGDPLTVDEGSVRTPEVTNQKAFAVLNDLGVDFRYGCRSEAQIEVLTTPHAKGQRKDGYLSQGLAIVDETLEAPASVGPI